MVRPGQGRKDWEHPVRFDERNIDVAALADRLPIVEALTVAEVTPGNQDIFSWRSIHCGRGNIDRRADQAARGLPCRKQRGLLPR